MSSDKASSDIGSGGTSGTKPPPPDAPAEKLTEAEYLRQQAHNAQLAMAKAFAELKTRLGQGADPKAWAQEYPWVTVGAAAVAGFVAATTLIPSKEQQALKRLAAIEHALRPPPPPPERANGDHKPEQRGMLATILHEAIALLRPALVSLMTAGIVQPPEAAEAQGGGPAPPGPDPGRPYGSGDDPSAPSIM